MLLSLYMITFSKSALDFLLQNYQKKCQKIKMWDKYWLQFRSTISEDFEETEVSEITLTITSFVKKESVEALICKKTHPKSCPWYARKSESTMILFDNREKVDCSWHCKSRVCPKRIYTKLLSVVHQIC